MLIFLSNFPSSFKLCFLGESGKTIWFLMGLWENSIIVKGYFQGISYVFLENSGKILRKFLWEPCSFIQLNRVSIFCIYSFYTNFILVLRIYELGIVVYLIKKQELGTHIALC